MYRFHKNDSAQTMSDQVAEKLKPLVPVDKVRLQKLRKSVKYERRMKKCELIDLVERHRSLYKILDTKWKAPNLLEPLNQGRAILCLTGLSGLESYLGKGEFAYITHGFETSILKNSSDPIASIDIYRVRIPVDIYCHARGQYLDTREECHLTSETTLIEGIQNSAQFPINDVFYDPVKKGDEVYHQVMPKLVALESFSACDSLAVCDLLESDEAIQRLASVEAEGPIWDAYASTSVELSAYVLRFSHIPEEQAVKVEQSEKTPEDRQIELQKDEEDENQEEEEQEEDETEERALEDYNFALHQFKLVLTNRVELARKLRGPKLFLFGFSERKKVRSQLRNIVGPTRGQFTIVREVEFDLPVECRVGGKFYDKYGTPKSPKAVQALNEMMSSTHPDVTHILYQEKYSCIWQLSSLSFFNGKCRWIADALRKYAIKALQYQIPNGPPADCKKEALVTLKLCVLQFHPAESQ